MPAVSVVTMVTHSTICAL